MSHRPSKISRLLERRPAGLYCLQGDFYIDPVSPVGRAVITHGHADHARPGQGHVLATPHTIDICEIRYGEDHFANHTQKQRYGDTIRIKDVNVTLYPAGHVLGSAQVLIEGQGERIVVSGDYKRQSDPTTKSFEVIPCDVFITEATFGLPVFKFPNPEDEIHKLITSLHTFTDQHHLIGSYALGKAQRIIALIRKTGYDKPIYLHGALEKLCRYYRDVGVPLGDLIPASKMDKTLDHEIVMAPPGALKDRWARRFGDAVISGASGWYQVRVRARQRGVELPMVISDHADWPDLQRTILETGCERVLVTHGQEDALVHWARSQGLDAEALSIASYSEDEQEEVASYTTKETSV